MLSEGALRAEEHLPAKRLSSSHTLRWSSVLARTYAEPAEAEPFSTAATPEPLVVVQLAGVSRIQSRRSGGWASALYTPGSIGLTAPGTSSVLRWRPDAHPPPGAGVRTLQLHLDAALCEATAHALGRPGSLAGLPDALRLTAPSVLATATAIGAAAAHGAEGLVADALAQALAAQLLALRAGVTPTCAGRLSTRQVQVVIDHMRSQLALDVRLEDLAGLVHLSRYHFLRKFHATTGMTPHRYLVRLRVERGAQLLRTTRLTVLDVASRCGYASPGRFSDAFRRHHGLTPGAYRTAHGR